jgi:hypothetical protein
MKYEVFDDLEAHPSRLAPDTFCSSTPSTNRIEENFQTTHFTHEIQQRPPQI